MSAAKKKKPAAKKPKRLPAAVQRAIEDLKWKIEDFHSNIRSVADANGVLLKRVQELRLEVAAPSMSAPPIYAAGDIDGLLPVTCPETVIATGATMSVIIGVTEMCQATRLVMPPSELLFCGMRIGTRNLFIGFGAGVSLRSGLNWALPASEHLVTPGVGATLELRNPTAGRITFCGATLWVKRAPGFEAMRR